jgi:hypothetical protein
MDFLFGDPARLPRSCLDHRFGAVLQLASATRCH